MNDVIFADMIQIVAITKDYTNFFEDGKEYDCSVNIRQLIANARPKIWGTELVGYSGFGSQAEELWVDGFIDNEEDDISDQEIIAWLEMNRGDWVEVG